MPDPMQADPAMADARPVLVVEDCDDDFDTVVDAAARAGVPNVLVRAVDTDAARHLLTRDSAAGFAFMLLDSSLPGQDGLALLDQLRAGGLHSDLPVVVFTTSINPHDRDLFRAAGASAFHVKSVQHSDTLGTLQAIFRLWLNRSATPDDAAIPWRARPSTSATPT